MWTVVDYKANNDFYLAKKVQYVYLYFDYPLLRIEYLN